ncbi:hypothetical protein ACFFHM_06660 [Halalkalibacter kiskunsagensis]|uniref:Uncharacterized protein n=1 Tax=Halalkalibacter kiskunsagensis TaxID=1548599 RepID=A0ABV6KA72_9BACI
MQQEIMIIIMVFIFFILTGLFGGFGIYCILHQKRKQAIWSFCIGFLMIIIYLLLMFGLGIGGM